MWTSYKSLYSLIGALTRLRAPTKASPLATENQSPPTTTTSENYINTMGLPETSRKRNMAFRFKDLTTELALEIIRFAATPNLQKSPYNGSDGLYYSNAVRLASVSHFFRQATMPYLLETVILSTHRNHLAFSNAFLLQERWRKEKSRLALDYSQYIRRFWSSFCHPTIAGQWHISADELDFDLFARILCNVETLGFAFNSLHLLYLSLENKNVGKWRCKRLILAGSSARWNPLISSPEGLEFLGGVTHLAVWVPQMHYEAADIGKIIPPEVQSLPLEVLPSLSHFACTVWEANPPPDKTQLPGKALLYSRYIRERGLLEAREKLRSSTPLDGGVVVPFREALKTNWWPNDLKAWEGAFIEGYAESVWAQGNP